jgi:carbamoyl-phosphate synthase large subunit
VNIAVTGLNATDNPGPGVPVIRSLRESDHFSGRVIGLAYDTLEPGIFMDDMVDRSYLIPYPSSGLEAVLDRLQEIHRKEKLDFILPTLDTEMYVFYKLADRLKEMGIHTFLPTTEMLNLRGKDALSAFCESNRIRNPKTVVLHSARDLEAAANRLDYPLFIKGIFYGATKAANMDEATAAFNKNRAQWGLPIIAQESLEGAEFNVAALGDGEGETIGAVAMRKMYITDKGKGWAGVSIFDAELLELARTVIRKLKWAGGLELEFMKSKRHGEYYLLEINPRFPAWIYLATAAGQNMPAACMNLALGQSVKPMREYEVGKLFVRCSWDLISDMKHFEHLTTEGEA